MYSNTLCLTLLASTIAPALAASPVNGVVDLGYIKYQGKNTNGITLWKNIPYAHILSSSDRFAAPKPITSQGNGQVVSWGGKGSLCPNVQPADPASRNPDVVSALGSDGRNADVTEDCLWASVWAPSDAVEGDNLPVLVYIAGGGFTYAIPYGGDNVTRKSRVVGSDGKVKDKGIVTITLMYRIGVHGNLAGSGYVDGGGELNLALKDQRMLLTWVAKYISKFGGNPNHIVISGPSAGGTAALMHMTAKGGDNSIGSSGDKLFHGAIIQSAGALPTRTIAQAQYQYDGLLRNTGCEKASSPLACLRALSSRNLLYYDINYAAPGRGKVPEYMYSSVIEPSSSGLWNRSWVSSFSAGAYSRVPLIIGTASNEGTVFTSRAANSQADMNNFLLDEMPLLTSSDLSALASTYSETVAYPNAGKYWAPLAKAFGDIRYICPAITVARSVSSTNKVWAYKWDVATADDVKNGYGTRHSGADGKFTGHLYLDEISGYFLSFVKTLDPNTLRNPGTPSWGNFQAGSAQQQQRLVLANKNYQEGPPPSRLDIGMQGMTQDLLTRCERLEGMKTRFMQ